MANLKPDDQEATLQKSVDAAGDSCRWMETELGAARKAAADATTASRKAIRDRNISAPLEQKQLAADLRVSNLTAEFDQAKIELAELENDLARCRKVKRCQLDASEFDKLIATFADAFDVANKANAALAASMEPLKTDLPDMLATFIFFSNVAAESPSTREMLLTLARQRRDAILAGAATLSKPAPPPAPIPLPPPTTAVCALRPIAWLADGAVRKAGAGTDVNLSPQTARHAIKIGACCNMSDPRRRTVKESAGFKVGTPLRKNCVDLDPNMPPDDEPEPFREPVLRSVPPGTIDPQFTVIPPSQLPPPRVMQVARSDADLIARNNKDKK
jgi:multidrug efflux pump subunit AcrA (membrane-fusion protein)